MDKIISDRYGTMSAEMEALIQRSRDSIGNRVVRKVRCPKCHHILMDAYGHADIPIMVICKKCKSENIMNLAFFRKQGRGGK